MDVLHRVVALRRSKGFRSSVPGLVAIDEIDKKRCLLRSVEQLVTTEFLSARPLTVVTVSFHEANAMQSKSYLVS